MSAHHVDDHHDRCPSRARNHAFGRSASIVVCVTLDLSYLSTRPTKTALRGAELAADPRGLRLA